MPRVGFPAITLTTGSAVVDLPESCTDPSAALDLAALSEGSLSPQGMERLAHHVVRCSSCQAVLAAVVQDTHAVDSTTKRFCDVNHRSEADRTVTRRYSSLRDPRATDRR